MTLGVNTKTTEKFQTFLKKILKWNRENCGFNEDLN